MDRERLVILLIIRGSVRKTWGRESVQRVGYLGGRLSALEQGLRSAVVSDQKG